MKSRAHGYNRVSLHSPVLRSNKTSSDNLRVCRRCLSSKETSSKRRSIPKESS